MRIETSSTPIRRHAQQKRRAIFAAILVVGVVLGTGLGALRRTADGTWLGMMHNLLEGPTEDHLPQLLLDLRFRGLQTLRDRRLAWHASGVRPSPEPSAVQAGLRRDERQLEVALSLLGPPQSRGLGDLGRMQVDVRGEGDFAGMRAFALDDPQEPSLLRELILYQQLAQTGAIAPRTLAVGVRINGERMGMAIAVEQPSSAMLLAVHRPLGALVGWEAVLPNGVDLDAAAWLPHPQPARWSTSARGLQGTPQESHPAWAQTRLDGLRAGQLAPEMVLNVDAMARLMALAELTGLADRVLDWQSLRWYLDPESLRLEPVVRLTPDHPGPQLADDALPRLLLASEPLRQAYATALQTEAARLMAADTQLQLQRQVAAIWPTLPPATWQSAWQVVQQRAVRVLAAETVPVEPARPMVFLPQPPTSTAAVSHSMTEADRKRAHVLLDLQGVPPINCFGFTPPEGATPEGAL